MSAINKIEKLVADLQNGTKRLHFTLKENGVCLGDVMEQIVEALSYVRGYAEKSLESKEPHK